MTELAGLALQAPEPYFAQEFLAYREIEQKAEQMIARIATQIYTNEETTT